MIKKIISGGQTGGDRGGLEAGKKLGIETGGTAPKGYRTDIGKDYSLKEFGLVEHESWKYPPRTIENIRNSDATIWFGNVNSPGAKLTIGTCKKLHKEVFINIETPKMLRYLLDSYFIHILNVAGNREKSTPGIQKYVEDFLIETFAE